MSTTGRTAAAASADALAEGVREAGFVRLVAAADGDSLAAAGLLARGCRAVGVPFQASVARTDAARERLLGAGTDDCGVLVGTARGPADRAVAGRGTPASVTAHAAATALGADPSPALALAGAVAAGVQPGADGTAELLDRAREDGAVERRPGVALPVADAAEGLAHQTLVHADFAGDADASARLVADASEEADGTGPDDGSTVAGDATESVGGGPDPQALASLVALAVAGDGGAPERSADALERALRPYATPEGPFATLGGHADVLEATARSAPGTGIALALSGDGRESALDAWREHGTAAHAAVRRATTGRYDGLVVARLDEPAPVETVARLLLTTRSPEPAVLVVGEREAAAAAAPDADRDVGAAMRAAAAAGGEAGGDPDRAYARHAADPDDVVAAFREADA